MIFLFEAEKDAYVSNRKTSISNDNLSNVGRAATIDLFKLYNENQNVFSQGKLKLVDATPQNADTFTLVDADKNEVIFEFDNGANQSNPGINKNGSNNIQIGLSGISGSLSGVANHITNVINGVNNQNQNGDQGNKTLNTSAISNSDGEIILEQNKSGSDGDTTITLGSSSSLTKVDFRRIERSVGLLKLGISSFKEKYISNLANSSFSDSTKYKVEIILKDVSSGHTKPYDYTLRLMPLTKDFKEGLGKDTIHFSDKDICNFTNLTLSNTWKIPGYVSYSSADDIDCTLDGLDKKYESTQIISRGNEDLTFDITNWFSDVIKADNPKTDYGFVLDFSESIINDSKTYFVKRLGSRHLSNKQLTPCMKVSLKDSSVLKNIDNKNKKYYLDNAEDFYLNNKLNGELTAFSGAAGYNLIAEFSYLNNNSVKSSASLTIANGVIPNSSTITLIDSNSNTVTLEFDNTQDQSNIGKTIHANSSNILIGTNGLATKSLIASHLVSVINNINTYNQFDSSHQNPKNQILNITASLDADNTDNIFIINLKQTTSGTSGDTVISFTNITNEITKSDFKRFENITFSNAANVYDMSGNQLSGIKKVSLNNNQISMFNPKLNDEILSKGYATFDLNWKWVKTGDDLLSEVLVKKETIKFYDSDVESNTISKIGNIRTSIVIPNKEIVSENLIHDIDLFFYDSKKQYDVVKIPYDLPSENLGSGYYNVIDAESKKVLIQGSEDFSTLHWNGKSYSFSFYVPYLLKNKIINFEFVFKNQIYNTEQKVYNNNFKIRVL